ncbi:MAG TPA: SagB/ThcOx family dehydrogenase [Chloroflexota bacterium]|nr:SagB/ThcOx family dehydrogenase [Chloroflexota bacterium]
MSNRDVAATWQYHNGTKHSIQSIRANRHVLDFANQPIPYKIYTSLPPSPLPNDFSPSAVPGLDAIAATGTEPAGPRIPDRAAVARLCYFSNGITKVLRFPGGEMPFRAAACTGALFHIEHYVICGDLPGLPAGVYHYAAHDHALRRLRAGDYRPVLVAASGDEPAIAAAPAVIAQTTTYWRNAWKYQARAYRHAYWDDGTILANLLAAAAGSGLPTRVVLGFADEPVNRLLDVDPDQEAAISLVAVGRAEPPAAPAPPVTPLGLPTQRLSAHTVDYPAIRAMHAASSLASADEAAAWHGAAAPAPLPPARGPVVPLEPLPPDALPTDPIETVIRRRGSTRQFTRDPIGYDQLSTLLDRSTRGYAADYRALDRPLADLYLIVNAVDGLDAGTYVLRRAEGALERLAAGDYRDQAGLLDLGQELAADAAVNCYWLTDLEPLLARFGNRGYRAAQLDAAIEAGKLYLACYALRIGATGLTFFDDDVTTFFSPHATGKSVLFLVALGRPLRRRAPR